MLVANLTIQWPDGAQTRALFQSESADANAPVRYSGRVDRVTAAPPCSDLTFLRFVMKQAALEGGGHYEENLEGQHDRWAV